MTFQVIFSNSTTEKISSLGNAAAPDFQQAVLSAGRALGQSQIDEKNTTVIVACNEEDCGWVGSFRAFQRTFQRLVLAPLMG